MPRSPQTDEAKARISEAMKATHARRRATPGGYDYIRQNPRPKCKAYHATPQTATHENLLVYAELKVAVIRLEHRLIAVEAELAAMKREAAVRMIQGGGGDE